MKSKAGAEDWDLLVCTECNNHWTCPDVDLSWTNDPEPECSESCPNCGSHRVIREEQG